jgi:hypothetical protein
MTWAIEISKQKANMAAARDAVAAADIEECAVVAPSLPAETEANNAAPVLPPALLPPSHMLPPMVASAATDPVIGTEIRQPPPSDLLDGVYLCESPEQVLKHAKHFVQKLKPFYWEKPNVTRERNSYVKWMGETEANMIDADTHLLDVRKFMLRLVDEKFTESVEKVTARMNWTCNDTARVAHVMVDADAAGALRRLFQGSDRVEMDVGVSKADSFDAFAAVFNDASKVYAHPQPTYAGYSAY